MLHRGCPSLLVLGLLLGAVADVSAGVSTVVVGTPPTAIVTNGVGTTVNFPVTRSGDTSYPVVVTYATASNTGVGYSSVWGSVTLPAGSTNLSIPVQVVGAAAPQPDQTFYLKFKAAGTGPVPSFAAAGTFTVGDAPVGVAMADFNGDGKPDLAVANAGDGTVSILLNTTMPGASRASYGAPVVLPLDLPIGGSTSVSIGDFNGDGRPDLAITGAGDGYGVGTLVIVLNTTPSGAALPSFGRAASFYTAASFDCVAIADFNGDGKPDVAYVDFFGFAVDVALNTTSRGAASPAFAAGGSLQAGVTGEFPEFPNCVTTADFDGDGRPDLAVTELPQGGSILLNRTAPGAATTTFVTTNKAYQSGGPNLVADFNGDGRPDLASPPPAYSGPFVALNTTPPGANSPSFSCLDNSCIEELLLPFAFNGPLLAGDLNGDGKPDLISFEGIGTGQQTAILLNGTAPGGATFGFTALGGIAQVAPNPTAAALADINGDGKPDLVVADLYGNDVVALLNTTPSNPATLSFAAHADTPSTPGKAPTAAVVADFNGDGKPDLALADAGSNDVEVLVNATPPGALSPVYLAPSTTAVGSQPSALAVGDFNGDGRPDLAVLNIGDNTVTVLLNVGSPGAAALPSFQKFSFAVGAGPATIAVGDVNGDGLPDLVVSYANSSFVSVLLNTSTRGGGTVTLSSRHDIAAAPAAGCAVALVDLNGDSRPDLVLCSAIGNVASVLLNTTPLGGATPTFASHVDFPVSSPAALAVADFNGDGKPDLALAQRNSNSLLILFNSTAAGASSPNFAMSQEIATGNGPNALAVGDFDGDGKLDLAVAEGSGNTVSVLLSTIAPGSTTASFAPRRELAVGSGPQAVVVGDFNGDSRPGLVTANRSGNSISTIFNTQYHVAYGPAAQATIHYVTTTPSAPSGLKATAGNGQVSLGWNAVPGASSYNVYLGTAAGGESSTPAMSGVSGTSATVTGLHIGSTYYFVIRAVNSQGLSAASTEARATLPPLPSAPSNVSVTSDDSGLTLSWSAVPGATYYELYESTTPGSEQGIGPANGQSIIVSGLNGTRYYLQVSAVNSSGEGPRSAEVSATPTATGAPPAPLNLSATAGANQVMLSWYWSGAPGASINIYQATSPGGEPATPAKKVSASSAVIAGLSGGATYYFQVSTVDTHGQSPRSNEVSATIPLDAPTGVQATPGDGKVTISWNAVPGAVSYQVFKAFTPGTEGYTPEASGITGTSVDIIGLNSYSPYYFTVAAVGASVAGESSVEVHATPNGAQWLSPGSAMAGNGSFVLTVHGLGFRSSSTVYWEGSPRPTTFVSSTILQAQIPAADIRLPGDASVTVVNQEASGVDNYSPSLLFGIDDPAQGAVIRAFYQDAKDIVWDRVHGLIYLSSPANDPATTGLTPSSVVAFNPGTGQTAASRVVSNSPDLLAISGDDTLLYVGQPASGTVQRLSLPGLNPDISIPLNNRYPAVDMQVSPYAAHTIAISRDGDVAVFDDARMRPASELGEGSLQWGASSSSLLAVNNSYWFDTLSVTSGGVKLISRYSNAFTQVGVKIHYDRGTALIYSDDGHIINPSNGQSMGTFAASGLMVPDSSLKRAFFLGQTWMQIGTQNYTIESFDLGTHAPQAEVTLNGLVGTGPIKLIRWGANGLAVAMNQGPVYLLYGLFVNGTAATSPMQGTQFQVPAEGVHDWRNPWVSP